MLLAAGTMWGLAFSLTKLARTDGVSTFGYAMWQSVGGGLLLLLLSLARGQAPKLERRFLAYYLFSGIVGFALPNANMVFVLREVPAGMMAMLITLVPVLTYGLASAIGMERPQLIRVLGVAFGLAGALLIVVPEASVPSADGTPYILMALLTPICFTFSNIGMARWRPVGPGSHSLALACGMTLTAGTFMTIAAVATDSVYIPDFNDWRVRDWAIIAHMVITATAFTIFFELLRMVGPVVAGTVAFVVNCSGILWGMVIFQESHDWLIWVATALVLVGLVLVNRPARPLPAADRPPAT